MLYAERDKINQLSIFNDMLDYNISSYILHFYQKDTKIDKSLIITPDTTTYDEASIFLIDIVSDKTTEDLNNGVIYLPEGEFILSFFDIDDYAMDVLTYQDVLYVKNTQQYNK